MHPRSLFSGLCKFFGEDLCTTRFGQVLKHFLGFVFLGLEGCYFTVERALLATDSAFPFLEHRGLVLGSRTMEYFS
jgi:hypothetical protein